MGTASSKPELPDASVIRNLEERGELFATIDEVWGMTGGDFPEEDFRDCSGRILNLRCGTDKNGQPKSADVYQNILTKMSNNQGVEALPSLSPEDRDVSTRETARNAFDRDMRTIEPLSQDEKNAWRNTKNFLGNDVSRTRAHIVPNDEACFVFWGLVAEAILGFTDGEFTNCENPRSMALQYLKNLRCNRVNFPHEHAPIFDNLGDGVALLIPIMTLEKMGKWKQKEPYKVLVICSSPRVYQKVSLTTLVESKEYLDVASRPEIVQTTQVLDAVVRGLAEMLVRRWDDFFDRIEVNGTNATANKSMLREFKNHLEAQRTVKVPFFQSEGPEVTAMKLLCNPTILQSGNDTPILLTIDLGKIYKEEHAHMIPDPLSLAIKSAANFSAHCYDGMQNGRAQKWKLLPACASNLGNDSDDETSVGCEGEGLMMSRKEVKALRERNEALRKEEEALQKKELLGRQIIVTAMDDCFDDDDDDDSGVSSVSADRHCVTHIVSCDSDDEWGVIV